MEAVDRGLGEERVGHQCDPLVRLAVARDDRCGAPVSFYDYLVDGCGVLGVERGESEVDELCRRRHRSTYAEAGTMPIVAAGWQR